MDPLEKSSSLSSHIPSNSIPSAHPVSFANLGEQLRQLETMLTSKELKTAFALPDSPAPAGPVSFSPARTEIAPRGVNEGLGSPTKYSDSHQPPPPQTSDRGPKSLSEMLRSIPGEGEGAWADIHSLIQDLRICAQAPNAPILAVMGLLNAGKSSLVATYLSQKGRERVLIGSGNRQGTHRFVLWLPVQWKDSDQVWKYIESRLSTIFPAGYEYLSEDPEQAAAQYNDTSVRSVHGSAPDLAPVSMLEVPLVAFDPGLDALKIALMDCPDVQTGWLPSDDAAYGSGGKMRDPLAMQVDAIATKRLETLSRVAPICSAFVVVLPANGMHDQKVSELMQVLRVRMPHSQQLIAINRVPRRYMPEQIHQEVCQLYSDRLLQRIYMAYGFDGPHHLDKIPEPPPYFVPPSDGSKLPLFFRLDRDISAGTTGLGETNGSDRTWLLGIGQELDSQGLMVDVVRSQTSNLVRRLREAMSFVAKTVSAQNRRREAMRELLIEACLDFSREPGYVNRVRLQASRQIVEQISESLERTAPWWAVPGRWTSRLAAYGKQQVGQWVRLPSWVSGKAEDLMRQIRSRWGSQGGASVVTAELLLRALERGDVAGVWEMDVLMSQEFKANANQSASLSMPHGSSSRRGDWLNLIQQGIDRFQADSHTKLNAEELDKATRKMWEQMPLSKRIATGLAPAAVLFAPIAAVILIPFDFGGSSVLVFASLKELLGAGVAGIGIAMLSPDRMPLLAESEAAWQQLGDLVAVMCDEFGLERPTVENPSSVSMGHETRLIPVSNIEKRISQTNSLIPPGIRVRPGAIQQIESLLSNLS